MAGWGQSDGAGGGNAAPCEGPAGLTLERLTASPALTGTAPILPRWSPEGTWLAFLWNQQGLPVREIWLIRSDEDEPRCLNGSPQAGVSTEASPGTDAGVTDLVWTPDGQALLFLRGGELWEVEVAGGVPRRLTSQCMDALSACRAPQGAKSELGISPDGRLVSFLADGDLWVLAREGGAAARATEVGVPPIGSLPLGTYFRPDVEIGPATWGGPPSYAWSPDGRYIAVHYVDRRHVPSMSFPYYLGEAPSMNLLRRGRPGDANEVRDVGFYDVREGSLRPLELPAATEMRVVGFTWSPSGVLLIDRESDDAVDRHLLVVDPITGATTEIWHDHRESRTWNDSASAWHGDGRRVLLTGDLDDHYRIYLLSPGDPNIRAVTPGPYDVTGPGIPIVGTDHILYVSSEPSPYERHVWRIDEDGERRVRLTTRPGTHAPILSPDCRTLALLSSDDITPPELYLTSAVASTEPRRITFSQPADFAEVTWAKARYVTFPHRTDRFTLHARIIEPPRLDRSRRYPVIFGNMYSNTVRNRWETRFAALQQYLAVERGYIVVQVDVRGSTGYGREFREAFLMDWGGGDLEDIESAVEYLTTLPYVNGERMGIWGTSYGGTLTVYSLLRKPGLFRAGVAAAPAVDPHFFGSDDVAVCRRPQTHPEAFTRGALQYAANLRDHLLLMHGMQDDVVPFQTTVALTEELTRLGKDFEVAFAPAATHAWSQRPDYALYFMRRLVAHFDRYLKP